jgi:hypothetical protein
MAAEDAAAAGDAAASGDPDAEEMPVPVDSGPNPQPVDGGGPIPQVDSGMVVVPPGDGGMPPVGSVSVGAACTADMACNPAAGGFCLTQSQFPGGYCTLDCSTAMCPSGSSCWSVGMQSICLDNCMSPAECRQGYTCDSDNTCWPGMGGGGGGTTPIGGACTMDAQCAGTGAQCITASTWPGGYCTIQGCSAQSPCPSGSDCYQLQGGGSACFASCSSVSDCRGAPSYTCDQDACLPGCGATGCATGEVCDMTTGQCRNAPCTPGSCGAGLVCDTASGLCVVDVGTPPAGTVPSCSTVPDWRCTGTTTYCGEIVAFTPVTGPGYDNYPLNGETPSNQYRSFIRRDVMMLVKYAAALTQCRSASWTVGNNRPIGLGDMSEMNGAIPGTSIGQPGHPAGTHEQGRDMDLGYFQLRGTDNYLRPICAHTSGGQDQYHCVAPPDNLDVWRTSLFLAALHANPDLRIIGVDGRVGPLVQSAVAQLCARNWINTSACTQLKLAFETTDMMRGWYHFHHHHFHLSIATRPFAPEPIEEACLSLGCGAHRHDLEPLRAIELDTWLKRRR